MKTFGARLRYARTLRAMTQRQLAVASKLSQSAVGNYESDLRNSSRSLLRLAQALQVNPLWLESGQLPIEASEAGSYELPAAQVPPLRDELTDEPIPRPDEWLFDARDYALYQQLRPQDRRFLKQAVKALMASLRASQHEDAAADSRPAPPEAASVRPRGKRSR